MNESQKYLKVGTSLYRYGTQGNYFAIWKEHGKLRKQKLTFEVKSGVSVRSFCDKPGKVRTDLQVFLMQLLIYLDWIIPIQKLKLVA